jgi:glycosyltransferase involved in cell wall biosynthesis
MKISACWIAKNEEHTLPRSIRSVSRIADEIIVVDTGSTDGTVEAVKDLKAHVYEFEWTNDFSAARNFALSKASGDAVVFLDADEYFEPALARKDRQVIEDLLSKPGINALLIKLTNINGDTGKTIDVTEIIRIYLHLPDLRYVGSVHEVPQIVSGGRSAFLTTYRHPNWNIVHTGYSPSLIRDKLIKYIAMLEESLNQTDDPFTLFLTHSYLLREFVSADQYEPAFPHLQYLLDHPEWFKEAYRTLRVLFYDRIISAFKVAKVFRDKVSRKQIYHTIILPGVDYLSALDYQVIVLTYQILFDFQPHRFVEEFSHLSTQLPSLSDARELDYIRSVYYIRLQAFDYFFAIGSYDKAFGLIDDAVRNPIYRNSTTIPLLLDCLYGQPDDMVIQYLYSVLDLENQEMCDFLTKSLLRRGRKNVFLYLQKKRLDAGKLTKPDFLYLLLASKNYDQVRKIVASLEIPEDQADMASEIDRILFLTSVVSGDKVFYDAHQERLIKYSAVLDSYFSGTLLNDISPADMSILSENFYLISFAGDLDILDRFLRVFGADSSATVNLLAEYYYENRFDREFSRFAKEELSVSRDSLLYLCRSLIRLGEYGKCLPILQEMLQNQIYDNQVFQLIYVVSQNGQVYASKAREVYDRHLPLCVEAIDTRDRVCTSYIPPEIKG